MSEYKFYYPDGTEIGTGKNAIEEFIKCYNKLYYLDDKSPEIPRLNRSSCFIEEIIDKLLEEGIKSEADVFHILAWKVGKIKHGESQKERRFIYADGWNEEENTATRYSTEINVKDIENYLIKNISELEELARSDWKGVFDKIYDQKMKEKWNGIGYVYCFTLLYFISRGKYPIYDKFACIALNAIKEGLAPGSNVPYKSLDNLSSAKEEYKKYQDDLSGIFDSTYSKAQQEKDRSLDRALWVYGHLFSSSKNNC